MAGLDAGRGAELVDPRGAGGGAVEAGLDAVAFGLDFGEGQVDFGDDAGYVEAFDVCGGGGGVLVMLCYGWGGEGKREWSTGHTANAAFIGDFEVGADAGLRGIIADGDGAG